MSQLTDQEIVTYLQASSTQKQDTALRQIYRDYYRMIVKYILDNSGNEEEAKEMFQNGIIVFFNKVKQQDFELKSTCKTFLYAICKNLWLNELRKTKRLTPLLNQHKELPSEEDIVYSLEASEQQQLLGALLDQVGEECKNILLRYYYYRLKIKQIQLELNYTSEQVVKNKKGKCIKRLRQLVTDNPGYQAILK